MKVVSLKICGEFQRYVWLDGALLGLSDLLEQLHGRVSVLTPDPAIVPLKLKQPQQDSMTIEV